VEFGEFGQAESPGSVLQYGMAIDREGSTTDPSSFELGSPHAGTYPLNNKVALQFGDGADDDDQGAAQRAAAVDVLAEGDELDLEMIQLVEDLQEMTDRPRHAVEGPEQNDIELAAAGNSYCGTTRAGLQP